ncbi:MAG: rRNA adenine N-6-methyltransferase family protein [Clostridium sp.]
MKPYNKEFFINKVNEYNNIISSNKIGSYSILKRDGLQGIIKGYLYEKEDEYNVEIPELWGEERVWMRLSPLEIEGSYQFIKLSEGKVGVVGLGLGYVVQELAKKSSVKEIIVYEISKDVIDLYNKNFKKNPKIKILNQDAFKAEKESFDWFYVDIYEYKLTDKVVEDYKIFMELHEIENYAFFGVEAFLLSCAFEDIKWIYIPENWMEMVSVLHEAFEKSGYKDYKSTMDEELVFDILMKFKEILNN